MKRIYSIVVFLLFFTGALWAQNLQGTIIYVNPGHGGFDSDDRNITIAPYLQGDPKGFWESQSNLDKGMQLVNLLKNAGATVYISRTTNTHEDDLDLSQIVQMANDADADYMLSIHSNAGVNSYVLQLYAGIDPDDKVVYPTPTPHSEEGRIISTLIANNLYSNKANTFGAGLTVRGDKTFARTAMQWSDGYGVLRGLNVPGCISEASMHDYIPETYRLMNMDYKWLEAWHFYKSFCTYFKAGDSSTGNIAGTVHDSRNKNLSNYYMIKGTKDELLPLCKAKVTLNPGNIVYTTDDLFNGFYLFKELKPGTYQVTTEMQGYQTKTETLEVKSNETSYLNVMLDMVRNTPPAITNYSPNVDLNTPVECTTPIVFEFNWDVDVDSAVKAFSISPKVEGTITFEDSQHRMIFKPNVSYDKSTAYTVKLDKSLQHPGGMSMQNDCIFQFVTKNRNRLTMFAVNPKPSDEAVYYVKPVFEFRFDKALNPLVIRDAIKVYDSRGVELAKNLRSLKTNKLPEPYGSHSFLLNGDLVPGETYTVKLSKSVLDDVGLSFETPIEYTFKATDLKLSDKKIAEDFEGINIMTYNLGESKDVLSASALRNTSQKLFGTSAYTFSYTFNKPSEGIFVSKVVNPTISLDGTKVVGMYVCGDLTNNILSIQLASETSSTKVVKVAPLDFLGWKYIEVPLKGIIESNGYILSGIVLQQSDGPMTTSGNFSLDNILVYEERTTSAINQVVNDVVICPNPVSDMINISTSVGDIKKLELYSLNGNLVKQSSLSQLKVSDIPSGTYILKVFLLDKTTTQTIIIKNNH